MKFSEYKKSILEELDRTLDAISEEDVVEWCNSIQSARRIFIQGVGRSGFMLRCFAMRLMHMGFNVYFLGETITPGTSREDLLILGSGSGETPSLVAKARKAKEIGCRIALMTISKDCSLGRLADQVMEIPAPSSKLKKELNYRSIQPMGSLFEQALLFTCEILILKLMEQKGITSEAMFRNHANLE